MNLKYVLNFFTWIFIIVIGSLPILVDFHNSNRFTADPSGFS